MKSGTEKVKTPAGEYLTTALMEFDPDQFESFAAIADGANKLLMLVFFFRVNNISLVLYLFVMVVISDDKCHISVCYTG